MSSHRSADDEPEISLGGGSNVSSEPPGSYASPAGHYDPEQEEQEQGESEMFLDEPTATTTQEPPPSLATYSEPPSTTAGYSAASTASSRVSVDPDEELGGDDETEALIAPSTTATMSGIGTTTSGAASVADSTLASGYPETTVAGGETTVGGDETMSAYSGKTFPTEAGNTFAEVTDHEGDDGYTQQSGTTYPHEGSEDPHQQGGGDTFAYSSSHPHDGDDDNSTLKTYPTDAGDTFVSNPAATAPGGTSTAAGSAVSGQPGSVAASGYDQSQQVVSVGGDSTTGTPMRSIADVIGDGEDDAQTFDASTLPTLMTHTLDDNQYQQQQQQQQRNQPGSMIEEEDGTMENNSVDVASASVASGSAAGYGSAAEVDGTVENNSVDDGSSGYPSASTASASQQQQSNPYMAANSPATSMASGSTSADASSNPYMPQNTDQAANQGQYGAASVGSGYQGSQQYPPYGNDNASFAGNSYVGSYAGGDSVAFTETSGYPSSPSGSGGARSSSNHDSSGYDGDLYSNAGTMYSNDQSQSHQQRGAPGDDATYYTNDGNGTYYTNNNEGGTVYTRDDGTYQGDGYSNAGTMYSNQQNRGAPAGDDTSYASGSQYSRPGEYSTYDAPASTYRGGEDNGTIAEGDEAASHANQSRASRQSRAAVGPDTSDRDKDDDDDDSIERPYKYSTANVRERSDWYKYCCICCLCLICLAIMAVISWLLNKYVFSAETDNGPQSNGELPGRSENDTFPKDKMMVDQVCSRGTFQLDEGARCAEMCAPQFFECCDPFHMFNVYNFTETFYELTNTTMPNATTDQQEETTTRFTADDDDGDLNSTETCSFDANLRGCMSYSKCQALGGLIEPAPSTLPNLCSEEGLLKDREDCESVCSQVTCCTSELDSCLGSNLDICMDYSPCQNLRPGNILPTAPDDLDLACLWGSAECWSTCELAQCCSDPGPDNCLQQNFLSCMTYAPCHNATTTNITLAPMWSHLDPVPAEVVLACKPLELDEIRVETPFTCAEYCNQAASCCYANDYTKNCFQEDPLGCLAWNRECQTIFGRRLLSSSSTTEENY